MIYGHIRDFMRNVGLEKNRISTEKNREVRLFYPVVQINYFFLTVCVILLLFTFAGLCDIIPKF